MKTVNDLLQSHYLSADKTPLQLAVTVDLAFLRANASVLGALPLAERASSTPAAPAKKAKVTPKRPAPVSKAPAKASATRVSKASVEAVAAAIKAGHTTPTTIAQHLGVDRKLINRALSRYVESGKIKRTGKGQYGVKR